MEDNTTEENNQATPEEQDTSMPLESQDQNEGEDPVDGADTDGNPGEPEAVDLMETGNGTAGDEDADDEANLDDTEEPEQSNGNGIPKEENGEQHVFEAEVNSSSKLIPPTTIEKKDLLNVDGNDSIADQQNRLAIKQMERAKGRRLSNVEISEAMKTLQLHNAKKRKSFRRY